MLLSPPQIKRFWREWLAACRAQQWVPNNAPHAKERHEIEAERHALLQRAGFASLTHVDKVAGFSRVLEQLAILKNDLTALRHAEENPRRVLLNTLETYAKKLSPSRIESAPFGSTYLGAILIDRFGHMDLDRLSDTDLEQIRFTLADRLTQQHQVATKSRRRVAAHARRQAAQENPEARIKFTSPDTAEHPHSDCGGYYCDEDHGHIDCSQAPVKSDPKTDPEHVPF